MVKFLLFLKIESKMDLIEGRRSLFFVLEEISTVYVYVFDYCGFVNLIEYCAN